MRYIEMILALLKSASEEDRQTVFFFAQELIGR